MSANGIPVCSMLNILVIILQSVVKSIRPDVGFFEQERLFCAEHILPLLVAPFFGITKQRISLSRPGTKAILRDRPHFVQAITSPQGEELIFSGHNLVPRA